jgi:hypothetical protein
MNLYLSLLSKVYTVIVCSSPVMEDVPQWRDRSIHGVPPSVTELVHLQNIPLHPTSVNTLHTYGHPCMRTQLAIAS